jgi:hypothetical protein
MKILKLAALALATCAFVGVASAGSNDSAVTVKNSSLWEIHEMYFSSTASDEWGPDQLGQEVIPASGGEFVLHSIPCGEYDVKLVDEDGDECEVREVGVCAASGTWEITDEDLLECQNETSD